MTIVSFPVIRSRLETLLNDDDTYSNTDQSGRARLQFDGDTLFHVQLQRFEQPSMDVESCLRTSKGRDRVLLGSLHVAVGMYSVEAREFVPSLGLPEWTGNFRNELPLGNSFELALAVGFCAINRSAAIPPWVTFTGAIELTENPETLRFAKTDSITEKVRLALGLDGYERYDPLREAFDTNLEDCKQFLGSWESRSRPGHIRLMFVPNTGFNTLQNSDLNLELQPLREVLPHGTGDGPDWTNAEKWLDDRFRVVDCDDFQARRMLVVGADNVKQVLRFLRLRHGNEADGLRAMVVGLSPPQADAPARPVVSNVPLGPAIEKVTFSIADCRASRPPIEFTLCRVPTITDRVICMLEDAVTEQRFAALMPELRSSLSRYPWPCRRTMSAEEAVRSADNWIDTWRIALQNRCADETMRPVSVRLPRVSEWSRAVADEELSDPKKYSQSVIGGSVETGPRVRGAQRRISPNPFGLFNLLGNVQEIVISDTGDDCYCLAGYSEGAITDDSLTRMNLPVVRFTGRRSFSFRTVLEFRNEESWQSFREVMREEVACA